jgi:hypothetical protein
MESCWLLPVSKRQTEPAKQVFAFNSLPIAPSIGMNMGGVRLCN